MHAESGYPETLTEAVKYFAAGDNAFNFMVSLRWGKDAVNCPTCGATDMRFISTRKIWECKQKHAKKQFSVKVGTIFEDSPIKLETWFSAMWMLANCTNGVSSYEIGRELGVTQKTGWFMLQRIRLAMTAGTVMKMNDTVEADETFVGGKSEFMHKNVKSRRGVTPGNGMVAKTAAIGVLQRPTEERPISRVIAEVLPEMPAKRAAMRVLHNNVEAGSEVHTDKSAIYEDVRRNFIHGFVDHAERYVEDNVHTNGLENFWSLLKRSIKGTYVSVEPFHLFRYVTEQVFRFNERKDDNHGPFLNVVRNVVGKRLTYRQLIGAFGTEAGDVISA